MDIPINADVQCVDGLCGRSTYVILKPATRQVTHLVVREHRFPHTEHLVPVDWIVETTPARIRLRCTAQEVLETEPFIEAEYVPVDIPSYSAGASLWPYRVALLEQVVPGELAIQPRARVQATDGRVGHVDEFLVEPATGRITHLVVREGHLWGQKDVTIPVVQIDRIEEDTVYLKLDKHAVGALSAIPVRRR